MAEHGKSTNIDVKKAVNLIDWEGQVKDLVQTIKSCTDATNGVMQFDVDGKRVEIQLHITAEDEDFLI